MADIGSLLGAAGIGGTIGKAIVSLELDTKKYQAELKGAQAQTVTSTNGMASSTSKFSAIAKQAYLAVGVAAVAGLAYSVKAAIEANEAHIKLANTFKNNANLADSSVEAFENQAGALQLLTGTSDEAIISAQALLGAFDVTGQQIQQLTPLIVDLAAKYGVDLDAAAKAVGKALEGNTGSLARYGVTLDAAALSTDAFGAVLQGLGKNAGFAEERANAEPWRILKVQFDELAEDVGNVRIPFLRSLASILQKLGPVLRFAGDHANELLLALAGYAALRYLPGLLGSIAGSFTALSTSIATGGAVSAGGIIGTLGALVGALPQIAASAPMAAGGIVEVWEALHPTENFATPIIEANVALTALSETAQGNLAFIAMHFEDAGRSAGSFQGQVDSINESLADAGIQYTLTTGALERLVAGESVAGLGAGNLTAAQKALAEQMDEGGKAAQRFGFKSKSAFQDFKQGVEDSVQVGIGQFEKLGDAFDTTPKELQKALDLAITIARREQKTLTEIFADDSLSKAQKTALAALPANQRQAWADSNKAGKEEIAKGAVELQRLNERSFREITNAAKGPAKQGGKETGSAIMTGAIQGVAEGAPGLKGAVERAVRDAIQAGKDAAGATSPSKVMRELGLDMMTGLYQGITAGAQKVLDAATKEVEKLIDKIGSALDKVKGKAESFADSIRSGFSAFMDLSGAFELAAAGDQSGVQGFISSQINAAAQLADVLQALKAQGASQALLSAVAGGGAGAIPFAQMLLQGGPDAVLSMNESLKQISDLANQTGKGLSEHFFGEKIDRLEAKLERQNEILRDIREIERMGHGHAIILNGQVLGEAVRDELVKIGNRNGNALG